MTARDRNRILIVRPGWWMTQSGNPVAIQYWDHNFQPYRDANWRGMMILATDRRRIRNWECLWYTVHGQGWFPDYRLQWGEFDIVRPLRTDEIPADKPVEWMPDYDGFFRHEMAKKQKRE